MSYYEINQEKRLKYQNEYYQKNKVKINERQKTYFKKYYHDHRKQLIEKSTKYRQQIVDPFKNINYYRMWQIKNKDKCKTYLKTYYLNNIDKMNKHNKEYNKKNYLNKKLEKQNNLNKIIQDELCIKRSCIIDFEEYNNEFYI